MSQPPLVGPLRALFWYVSKDDMIEREFMDEVRTEILAMSALVFHYFEVQFDAYPYKLLHFVDPTHHEPPAQVIESFLMEPWCNKDEWFSRKVQTLFPTSEKLLNSDALKQPC